MLGSCPLQSLNVRHSIRFYQPEYLRVASTKVPYLVSLSCRSSKFKNHFFNEVSATAVRYTMHAERVVGTDHRAQKLQ